MRAGAGEHRTTPRGRRHRVAAVTGGRSARERRARRECRSSGAGLGLVPLGNTLACVALDWHSHGVSARAEASTRPRRVQDARYRPAAGWRSSANWRRGRGSADRGAAPRTGQSRGAAPIAEQRRGPCSQTTSRRSPRCKICPAGGAAPRTMQPDDRPAVTTLQDLPGSRRHRRAPPGVAGARPRPGARLRPAPRVRPVRPAHASGDAALRSIALPRPAATQRCGWPRGVAQPTATQA